MIQHSATFRSVSGNLTPVYTSTHTLECRTAYSDAGSIPDPGGIELGFLT